MNAYLMLYYYQTRLKQTVMKQSRFICAAIAACMLFCSADIFAQRSRDGGGSGGRMEGGSRSVSYSSSGSGSHSGSSSRSYSSSSSCCGEQVRGGYVPSEAFRNPDNSGSRGYNSSGMYSGDDSFVIFFSKKDVLRSSCPNYGYEVSKRTATKGSILIHHSIGDLYYRDGIFFSKCPEGRKYAIYKPNCGLHVPVIPVTSSVYELNGTTYYYYYATYYTFDESTFDFVVVTPPVGLVVDKIPCDAKEIIVDDEYYYFYIVGNILYKEVDSKYEVAMLDKEAMHQIKDFLASNK